VEVVHARGTVRAAAVVIATDLPQPDLRALHRHLRQVESVVVTVPSVPVEIRRGLGTATTIVRDMADPRHCWRVQNDGGLIVWQAGRAPSPPRQREAAVVRHSGELMYEFSVLHHAISGVQPSAGWIVASHRSQDGMVIAGPHRAFPRHLFAVGGGVDGLQSAHLAARLNLRHHLGATEAGDDLFGFIR
jgi:glycine/D-amino acid oxidase-like deaminating enzyme